MDFSQFSLPKTPEEIPALFVKYWNERQAAGIASLFKEDAEFVNVVGLWWHNRQDIYKAHDYGLKVIFKDSEIKMTKTRIKYILENVAIVHAKMKLTGQTGHGEVNQPAMRQTLFTFVAEQTPQGWICVSAHNTDIAPGRETNIVDSSGNIKAIDYRK